MLNERLSLLNRTGEQMRFYFRNSAGTAGNEIDALEKKYKNWVNDLKKAVDNEIKETEHEFSEKLSVTEDYINEAVIQIRSIKSQKEQDILMLMNDINSENDKQFLYMVLKKYLYNLYMSYPDHILLHIVKFLILTRKTRISPKACGIYIFNALKNVLY